MTWRFDLATAVGGRAEQQDRAELFEIPDPAGGHLAVVADGMGGQQFGALAAQTVIDVARDALPDMTRHGPREGLVGFCEKAHEMIREMGRQRGANPASTCTAIYLHGDEAYWIHVGDSRLYHFRGDRLLYRTDDHTLGALLQGSGHGDGAPSVRGRQDNRLYMCLGGNNELEPVFGATAVDRDDWFLLCSDGFWNQVTGEEAASTVQEAAARPNLAEELVALAARRGGPRADNVSLVLATRKRTPARKPWWRR